MKASLKGALSYSKAAIFVLLFSLLLSLATQNSFAAPAQDQQSENVMSKKEEAYISALKAAIAASTKGPATIPLINQGTLKIPANYYFIPKTEAAAFMKSMGNAIGPEFVGLVFSREDHLRWFIIIEFIDSGYLKDDDADSWTADGLMKNLKDNNEIDNKERIANGFPALEIIGWVESPKYDAATHRLVWSILGKDKNSDEEPVVNYNTYVLGREGYFNLSLVAPNSTISKDKFIVHKILGTLNYDNGKRYEDFNESTDRMAEYGLAALVTGVVAKKLGLLGIASVFLIKLWKFLILLPLLLWGRIKKLLGIKTNE